MWDSNNYYYENTPNDETHFLNHLWETHQLKEVNRILQNLFKGQNVYQNTLNVIEDTKCKKKPKSLALHILKMLMQKFNSTILAESEITLKIKQQALSIASYSHTTLASLLIKSFCVDQPNMDMVKSHIENLLYKDNLKDAISLATSLNIQRHFSIYAMAVPALMQNKLSLVEDYLRGNKENQLEMLKILDEWLDKEFDLPTFCSNHNIHSVRSEVLKPQFQGKLLSRWLKLFNKEEKIKEICPNLCHRHSMSTVRYILYRYYDEQAMSTENMQELILKAVCNNVKLQMEVVDIVQQSYDDYDGAEKWERIFNLAPERSENIFQDNDELWGEEKKVLPEKNKEQFYQLSLSLADVIFVDNNELLCDCVKIIMEKEMVIGVDAEWAFSTDSNQGVALLQLAIHNKVFLIDVFNFVKQKNTTVLEQFLYDLLISKNHVKVGFGLSEDLHKLTSDFSSLKQALKSQSFVVDLHVVVRYACRLYPDLIKTINADAVCNSFKPHSGLSKLVQQTLGLGLDKSEQISDWERRPLRESQVKYSALDAFCLIEIYNHLSEKLKFLGSNYTLKNILNQKISYKSKSIGCGRGRGTHLNSDNSNKPSVSKPLKNIKFINVADFHVVCDNMLQGLGRQLRCCGADVQILSNFEDHDVAAHIARKENRIVLTSGAPYLSLSTQVPYGRCLDVPNELKAKVQVAHVLNHYKVKVTALDIFSRCQLCNGDKYLKVVADDMAKVLRYKSNPPLENFSSIPWDVIRQNAPSSGSNVTSSGGPVMCEEDNSSDEDILVMGSPENSNKIFESENVEKFQDFSKQDCALENLETEFLNLNKTEPIVVTSKRKSTYLINPKSISQNAKLDFTNGSIVSHNDKGCKVVTIIQIEQVPKPVCNQVDFFYCCVKCGKVYWEGNHFRNVVDKFSHLINS